MMWNDYFEEVTQIDSEYKAFSHSSLAALSHKIRILAIDGHRACRNIAPDIVRVDIMKSWITTGAYDYLIDQLVKSLGKEVNYNNFKQTWGFDYAY